MKPTQAVYLKGVKLIQGYRAQTFVPRFDHAEPPE
jgi:hypothetical protein